MALVGPMGGQPRQHSDGVPCGEEVASSAQPTSSSEARKVGGASHVGHGPDQMHASVWSVTGWIVARSGAAPRALIGAADVVPHDAQLR